MPNVKYGIFSGPSHAEEVSLGIPTANVIASKDVDIQDIVFFFFLIE